MKWILSACISFVLILSMPLTALAAPSKEEVIYGLLAADGAVNDVYAVNIWSGGEIIDYGSYSLVRNMTTPDEITQEGDQITVTSAADKLYYQGTLTSKELPWNIAVAYDLDGTKQTAGELAGKSGALNMTVTITQNPKVSSVFYESYAVQAILSLDTKLCENIVSENATIAEVGNKKQLTHTALPNKGLTFLVAADVHDFEMDAISVNGIKMALDISLDQTGLTEKTTALTDAVTKLDDGARAVNQNLSNLAVKSDTLIQGAAAIQSNVFDSVNKQLAAMGLGLPPLTPENYTAALSTTPQLAGIQAQLDSAVKFTDAVRGYTNGVAKLAASASELSSGTNQLNSELETLTDDIDSQIAAFTQEVSGTGNTPISFVSEKNKEISAVQFVLKTEAIKIPIIETEEKTETVTLNFGQKLLKLFGL